jgi:hypothetical protein
MYTANDCQTAGTIDRPVNDDVANVLEREMEVTIENWYCRVEKEHDLTAIPLSREQRCAHLPEMLHDRVTRLRRQFL